MEVWKIIPDFDEFEVSNLGNIRNIETQNPRRRQRTPSGFYVYFKKKNEKAKGRAVKKLVAEAFVENEENYSHVIFIDKNKFNPVWTNLKYITKHRIKRGFYVSQDKKKKDKTFLEKMDKMDKADLESRNYFKYKK